MAKILLTGATGFLGTRLAARLEARHELWVIGRRKDPRPGRRHWLVQDFADDRWSVALPDRIDAVIHLAQSPHYRDFPGSAPDIFKVSAGATMRLLEWARHAGARRFVLASTGGIYGASDAPVTEDDGIVEDRGPLGFYFATKRMSELAAAQYGVGDMTAAVLRLFFIYGSRQSPQMLIPRLVDSVRHGRPVALQGTDGIRINPIHVDDAVRAVEACLERSENRTINIAGPEVVSLRRIAELIGNELGRDPVFTVDRSAKPRHLVASIARMCAELGAPTIAPAEGLRELCGAIVEEREKT